MSYEIPMYVSSSICVRQLKIMEEIEGTSTRWVRSVTKSGSYEARIDSKQVNRITH